MAGETDAFGREKGDPGYGETDFGAGGLGDIDPEYAALLLFDQSVRFLYGNPVADLVLRRFHAAVSGTGQQRVETAKAAYERVPEFIRDALAKDKADRWHEFIQLFEDTKIRPYEGTPEGADGVKGIRALLHGPRGLLEVYEGWYQRQDHANQSAADAHTTGIETFMSLSARDIYREGNPGTELDDPKLTGYASFVDMATKIISDTRKRQRSLIDEYQRGVEKLRGTLAKTILTMPESDARTRLEDMRQGTGDKFVLDAFLRLDGTMPASEFLNGWYAIDMHAALTGTAYQAGLEEGNVFGSAERVGQEQKRMDFQEAYDLTLEHMTPAERETVKVSADDLWKQSGMESREAFKRLRFLDATARETVRAGQTKAGLGVMLQGLVDQGILPSTAAGQHYVDWAVVEARRTGETPEEAFRRGASPLVTALGEKQQKARLDAQLQVSGMMPFAGETPEQFSNRKQQAERARMLQGIGGEPSADQRGQLAELGLGSGGFVQGGVATDLKKLFQSGSGYQGLSPAARVAADAAYERSAALYNQNPETKNNVGHALGWLIPALHEGRRTDLERERVEKYRRAVAPRIFLPESLAAQAEAYRNTYIATGNIEHVILAAGGEAKLGKSGVAALQANALEAERQVEEENRPAPAPLGGAPETPESRLAGLEQARRTARARPTRVIR